MKRIISLLLICIFTISLVACAKTTDKKEKKETAVSTEKEKEKETQEQDILPYLTWEAVTGGIKITNYTGTFKSVTVPSVIDGKQVISISTAFSGNVSLEELILPESVASMASGSLKGCDALKILNAPGLEDSLPSMPSSLKELYLENLTGIYEEIFYLNVDLDVLYIPNASIIYGGVKAKNITIPGEIYYCVGYEWPYLTTEPDGKEVAYSEAIWNVPTYDEEYEPFYVKIDASNAAQIYCRFFQNDTVTVNGVTYTK